MMDYKVSVFGALLCAVIHLYSCQEYTSVVIEIDQSLTEPYFANITMPDIHTCAMLCQQFTKCASVSYNNATTICEMYSLSSTDGTLATASGYKFTDVTPSATMIGGCASRPCGDLDICLVDVDGNVRGCVTSLVNGTAAIS